MRRDPTNRQGWVLAVLFLAISRIGYGEALPAIKGEVEANVLVRGLQNPDGVAVHPQTKAVYVSERGAGRISVIQNGSAVPVVDSGWTVEDNIPEWAISFQKTAEAWKANRLESPGAINIGTNGHLYVAEFAPRGRILEFIPDAQGKFTKADALPVAWLDKPYAWDDVKISEAGRLYVAGSDAESLGGVKFGSVLVRETNGNWWAADYGPFVDYSSICYSEYQDVLVTVERRNGTLTWWDAYRHMVVGQIANLAPSSEVESVTLLADGAFVVAKKASPGESARLLRVDPLTGESSVLADGFSSVGSICCSPDSASVYVTVPDAGLLVECKLKNPPTASRHYLLRRSMEAFEASKRLTPKQAPEFLNKLFLKIGLGLIPEGIGVAGGTKIGAEATLATQYTLKNLANRIPMVAGRLKLMQPPGETADSDPLTDIDFLLLFPNKSILSGQQATPSYSYFSAKRVSGKVEQTRGLFENLSILHPQYNGKWVQETNSGNVVVPIASCSIWNSAEGEQLNLVFQGLGMIDDYCLTLHSGITNDGSLYVLKTTGDRVRYDTSFMEPGAGGEEMKNLVAAGFDPETEAIVGWLEIGQTPPTFAVQHEDAQLKLRTLSMNADVLKAIEQAESQYRVNQGGASSPEEPMNTSETNPLSAFEIITNSPATENSPDTDAAATENLSATNAVDQPAPAVTNESAQPPPAAPAVTNQP